MRSTLSLLLALALALPTTALAGPGGDSPEAGTASGAPLLIQADRIHTGTGDVIRGGAILVRDGKIAAVGVGIKAPKDARVVRVAVVIPGLVDAYSTLAGSVAGTRAVAPERRAVTDFDRYANYRRAVSAGVTSAYVAATGRLVGGQGAIVRLAGPPSQRVLSATASLEIALGRAGMNAPGLVAPPIRPSSSRPWRMAAPTYPLTKMAEIAIVRHLLQQAKETSAAGLMADVASGKRPLLVRAETRGDILRALGLADRFGVRLVLVGASEAGPLAAEIAKRKIPVIVRGLASGDRAQTFADSRSNPEGRGRLDTAATLSKAGVPVAISVDDPNRMSQLLFNAAVAVRAGMSADAALTAITSGAARAIGADGIGAIAAGASADLVAMSDDPFAAGSHVTRVLVAGRLVYRKRSTPDPGPTPALPLASQLVAIKCGTILTVGRGTISPGTILVARGKIVAVGGPGMIVPSHARVIDASRYTVAPGLIDAYGHLGVLQIKVPGLLDRTSPINSLTGGGVPLHLAVKPGDDALTEALRSGLTAALLAPSPAMAQGGASLIRLGATTREQLVITEHAALSLSPAALAGGRRGSPTAVHPRLDQMLKAGKAYHTKWQQYFERKKKGVKAKTPAKIVKVKKNDPISGTWSAQVSFRGRVFLRMQMDLKLEGTKVSGTVSNRGQSQEISGGNWDKASKTLSFNFQTPQGALICTAELVDKDTLEGSMRIRNFRLAFNAERTSGGGGTTSRRDSDRPRTVRPLEPYRALFEGKATALVHADTAGQVKAAIDVLKAHGITRVAVVGGVGARHVPGMLLASGVSVVLGPQGERGMDGGRGYLPAMLQRQGLTVALGSRSFDGAAVLPLAAAEMTRRGVSADEALRAMTINSARLLGVADRMGSIEPGKDADLVFWTGHPMAPASRAMRVLVAGKPVWTRK